MPRRNDIASILIIGAGPHDSRYLFTRFTEMMEKARH
jgi:hypothetical protein